MTNRAYSFRASFSVPALLLVAACGLAACAGDEGDDDTLQPPATMQDASAAVSGDTGVSTQPAANTGDAGAVSNPEDAGAMTPDTGVTAPSGDGGLTPDAGGMVRADQGMGDGKDVICIGDSWMHLSDMVGIQDSLLKVSKRPFRTFGVPGTLLLQDSVSGPAIPSQYEEAKKGGPIKTVIMTAGGNDVLQDLELGPFNVFGPGCSDSIFNDACKKRIEDVAAGLQKLWVEMAADGVTDVLIVSYSNKTLGGDFTKVSAYSSEKIAPICLGVPAPLRCSSFETDMKVEFKDRGDSIHPDDPTYDKIGAGVWQQMQDMGMRR